MCRGGWNAATLDPGVNLTRALLVFGASFIDDVTWVHWTLHTNRLNPWHSAFWAAAIGAIGAVSVVAIVDDHWYLIPTCLGLACGSGFTTAYHRRRDTKRVP